MSNAKFLGRTASEYIGLLSQEALSPSQKIARINKVLQDAASEIETQKTIMDSELGRMLAENLTSATVTELCKGSITKEKVLGAYKQKERERFLEETVTKIRACLEEHRAALDDLPPVGKLVETLKQQKSSSQALIIIKKILDGLEKDVQSQANKNKEQERIIAVREIKNELFVYEQLVKQMNSPQELIHNFSSSFKGGQPDTHRQKIHDAWESYHEIEDYCSDLEYESRQIRNDAALLSGESGGRMINWKRSEGDCKKLISFLIDNGYIDTDESINKFLVQHFLFKGEQKTAVQLGKTWMRKAQNPPIEEDAKGYLKIKPLKHPSSRISK